MKRKWIQAAVAAVLLTGTVAAYAAADCCGSLECCLQHWLACCFG